MTLHASFDEREIDRMIDRMCDQIATADELNELGRLVSENPNVRDRYLAALEIHAGLAWRMSPGRQFSAEELVRYGSGDSASDTRDSGFGVRDSGFGIRGLGEEESALSDFSTELSPFPSVSPLSPLPTNHYPLTTNFVGGPVFSYMVASVVLCAMLLGAWAYKITVGENHQIAVAPPATGRPQPLIVGRVTGMKDCVWPKDALITMPGASVPLGREYLLDSGLLEISYDSGARVILEGPCRYTADSRDGGFLRVGKLVARVEKNDELRMMNDESKRLASDIHHSSFINHPLFAIRTPTAIVTDLGTEFGVEVGENGSTLSRVYQGSVEVRAITAEGKPHGDALVLRENETALVEKNSSGKSEIVGNAPDAVDFVRDISELKYITFDLADVVAGGDGFSGRRNGGIDPTNGQVRAIRLPTGVRPLPLEGDGRYHSVEEMPFIDGVFIPDGGGDAVQVSSAGHVFDWFSDTSNSTWQPIWAGGAFSPEQKYSSKVGGEDYASPGHGLLLMLSSSAITFDLDAIRRANPGSKLLRFQTRAGMPGNETVTKQYFADVLVLADGTRRFQHRLEYNVPRAVSISVAIQENERFLTLAVTDAGDGMGHDWVVLGDPRLEMSMAGTNEDRDKGEAKR